MMIESKPREPSAPSTSTPFYVTGGTLRGDAASYVSRQADEALFTGLLAGEFCYVLDARQMGKSSLMIRTAARLEAEGITVIKLDLTAMGLDLSSEQWYFGLLDRLGRHLEEELEAFWYSHRQLGPLKRWFKAIEEVLLPRTQGRVVIFVDEIDIVRSLPFGTDEFFAGIRECYNRRASDTELGRLSFCLLGVATPSDLIQDVGMTPFNIGTRIELSDFTEEEAAPLAHGLMAAWPAAETGGGPSETADDLNFTLDNWQEAAIQASHSAQPASDSGATARLLLSRILHWTGGHPYLTQQLCRAVRDEIDSCQMTILNCQSVDRICADLFLSPRAQKQDNNLMFVNTRLLQGGADLAGLLELYGRVYANKRIADDRTDPLADHLRLSGIVRVISGYLRVRNRIYLSVFDQAWVRANMPGSEVRRQKTAYRRGLIRAASLSCVVLAAMAGLTLFAIGQKGLAEKNARDKNTSAIQARISERRAQTSASVAKIGEKRAKTEKQRQIAISKRLRLALTQRDTALNQAKQATSKAEESARVATREAERATAAEAHAMESVKETRRHLYVSAINHAQFAYEAGDLDRVRQILDSLIPKPGEEDLRGFEWGALQYRMRNYVCTLQGLHGVVGGLAYSPDGKLLAACSDDGFIKLWHRATWKEYCTFDRRARQSFTRLAFSPDGHTLASVARDGALRFFDIRTKAELPSVQLLPGEVLLVAYSPDGKRLATAGEDGMLRLWDAATHKPLVSVQAHDRRRQTRSVIYALAFSPDSSRIATGGEDHALRLWDAASGRLAWEYTGNQGSVLDVAFSPNGQILASTGDNGDNIPDIVKLWSVASGERVGNLAGHAWVRSIAFSTDGETLVGKDDTGNLWQWDVNRRTRWALTPGHAEFTCVLTTSPDGGLMAAGTDRGAVRIWRFEQKPEYAVLNSHTAAATRVAISPDGQTLASGSFDNQTILWDLPTGRMLHVLQGHTAVIMSIAFAPNGRTVATASWDSTVRLFEVATGRPLEKIVAAPGAGVLSVSYSPDGRLLATGSTDGSVRLWDAASGSPLRHLAGHGSGFRVHEVVFSPDGMILASCGTDSKVKLWSPDTGRQIGIIEDSGDNGASVNAVAFSPDGRLLASGGDSSIVRVWRVADGRRQFELPRNNVRISHIAFSPDGRRLASNGYQETIRLWDMRTHEQVGSFSNGIEWRLAMSPDWRTIAHPWYGRNEFVVLRSAPFGRTSLPPMPRPEHHPGAAAFGSRKSAFGSLRH